MINFDIFELYEEIKKYSSSNYDDEFYNATEGQAQIDIIKTILNEISSLI